MPQSLLLLSIRLCPSSLVAACVRQAANSGGSQLFFPGIWVGLKRPSEHLSAMTNTSQNHGTDSIEQVCTHWRERERERERD